jgi:truncated hemoglobin YjbI
MGAEVPTIYEWGGGRGAFARWLNRFYDLVELEAPEIAAMFGGAREQRASHARDGLVGGGDGRRSRPEPVKLGETDGARI